MNSAGRKLHTAGIEVVMVCPTSGSFLLWGSQAELRFITIAVALVAGGVLRVCIREGGALGVGVMILLPFCIPPLHRGDRPCELSSS